MVKSAEILIVDDNPGDAILLQEAFADRDSSAKLAFTRDGLEALDFLRREDGFPNAPRPDLVVLDLKMPGMDGLTFLKELRSDPSLKDITVVILTGSDAPEDRTTASSLGAVGYFTKPNSLDGWVSLSKDLEGLASCDGSTAPPDQSSR